MRLYLDGKQVIIFPRFLKRINFGQQGIVYQYQNKALKIPYNHSSIFDWDYDIDTKDCEHLKNINTKRILLPKDLLINRKGDLCAYTMERISKNDFDELFNISKDKFLEELYEVREELKLLSENNVKVHDFVVENFMYDGIFRFVDCGRYEIKYDNISKMNVDIIRGIRRDNNKEFQDFVINSLFFKDEIISSKMFTEVEEKMRKLGCSFVGEYVEKTMPKHATLNEYVKKKFISRI